MSIRSISSGYTVFWKARLERCYGWVPVRNLDNKALAASVRVLEDALFHAGLLLTAASLEFGGGARQKVRNGCGALLQRNRVVWLRFRIKLLDRLSWTGGPFLGRHREPFCESISGRVIGTPAASEAVRRVVRTPVTDSAEPYSLPHTPSIWLGATTGQRSWIYCS